MFALQHSKLYDAFSQKKLQFPFYGKLAAPNSHQGTPSSFAAFSSKKRQIPTPSHQNPSVQKPIPRPIPVQSAGPTEQIKHSTKPKSKPIQKGKFHLTLFFIQPINLDKI